MLPLKSSNTNSQKHVLGTLGPNSQPVGEHGVCRNEGCVRYVPQKTTTEKNQDPAENPNENCIVLFSKCCV